ncbi:MAG: ABC-2 type transporter [Lentisphaerae bacterium ADurb.Bin082]|nr:MAG: ABC-2 type transporter [Lentisphaerae bacterium ADurb.Bin082]
MRDKETFDTVITSHRGWFDVNIREIIRYRDLILMFVKRNFIANYKQTILGPAWAIVQPLLTTVVFTIVFGRIAHLPTDGVPPFLFYMCGNVAWGYFSGCLTQTATTFTANAGVMGKVYFPRLVMPISSVFSQLIQFGIQFLFLLFFLAYYSFLNNTPYITWGILYLPLLLLNMALLGLGCGVIISSLTTKYRDLTMLIGFGIHLWMYATPVVYTIDMIPEKWRALYLCNPMAITIELFRNMFFGTNTLTAANIAFCWGITLLITLGGILLFNRVEKTFMDTV